MLLESKSVPLKRGRMNSFLPPGPGVAGGMGLPRGGGRGRKIERIVKDSGASPEKAFSFAKQLIEEDKVFAIIGPSTSGETMKIKSVAAGGETILLSCSAAEANGH